MAHKVYVTINILKSPPPDKQMDGQTWQKHIETTDRRTTDTEYVTIKVLAPSPRQTDRRPDMAKTYQSYRKTEDGYRVIRKVLAQSTGVINK